MGMYVHYIHRSPKMWLVGWGCSYNWVEPVEDKVEEGSM